MRWIGGTVSGDLRPDFSFVQARDVCVQLRLRLREVQGAAGEGGLAQRPWHEKNRVTVCELSGKGLGRGVQVVVAIEYEIVVVIVDAAVGHLRGGNETDCAL